MPRRTQKILGAAAVVIAVGGAAGLYVWRQRAPQSQSSRATSSSAAYDAYLRGKVRVSAENREDNERAIVASREAISLDRNFAPAYAQLARAYAIKAFYFAPDSERKRLREDAEVADQKALALDPKLADGYFARGLLLWTPARRFPHEQAVQAYRQALALDSTLDEAHHQIALIMLHVGLLDEADAEIEKALAINPSNSLARFRLGVTALYRGQYDRAYDVFNSTALEQNPTLWGYQMATALFRLGREREATDMLNKFLRDYPADEGGVGTSVRAMMLAKAGKRPEAEAAIARSLGGQNFGHFHHTAFSIASAYALLGEQEKAIDYLQNAADNGFPCYPLFASDKFLDGVRKNPRFIAMMAKLEADWKKRKQSF